MKSDDPKDPSSDPTTKAMDKHFDIAKREASAAKILQDSGAAEFYETIGFVTGVEFISRVCAFAKYEGIRRLEGKNEYGLVYSALLKRQCRNLDEVLEARGLPRVKYFDLKNEEALLGSACATRIEQAGISWRTRKRLLACTPDEKKAVSDLIDRIPEGDKKALATGIAELLAAADHRRETEVADQKAHTGEQAKRAAFAEEKALKGADKLKASDAKVAELKAERDALRTELDTPDFARGDAAAIHKRIRDEQMQFSARVAYLEKHIFAPLVHWSEEGKPNHDLNRLALMILVDILTASSHMLSKALFAFDPQTTLAGYTALWAFRSLHQSPVTKEDIADQEKIYEQLADIVKRQGIAAEEAGKE